MSDLKIGSWVRRSGLGLGWVLGGRNHGRAKEESGSFVPESNVRVRRRTRLGGVLQYYHRAAA